MGSTEMCYAVQNFSINQLAFVGLSLRTLFLVPKFGLTFDAKGTGLDSENLAIRPNSDC